MQDLVIPGWATVLVSLFVPGFIAWLVWLTVHTFKNQKDIEINTANDKSLSNELTKIYDAIEKLERKIDQFIGKEIEILKEALNRKP